MNLFLEWFGAILGLLGAALIASNGAFARYGWWFFLAANVALIAWALRIDADGLLVQQTGFMFTSLLGLYRSGFVPNFCVEKNRN